MAIVQAGSTNLASQVVPGLTVTEIAPSAVVISGTPTGILGIVGSAIWGPVNTPSICSDEDDCTAAFGPMVARKYDLGTAVYVAALQNASSFRCVRVTDGTDTAASLALGPTELAKAPAFYASLANAINSGVGVLRGASQRVTLSGSGVLAALYTGSLGDTIKVSISAGSKAGTAKAVVGMGTGAPEVFDNIPAPALPTFQTVALVGGADGASGVTAATLVGLDVQPRSGLYALRGQGLTHVMAADADDSTQYTTIDAFAASESCYAVQVAPAGSTIAATATLKSTAGLDSEFSKLLHGDWLYVNDPVNLVQRMVSPQGFAAGKLAALAPNQSSLNKPLVGIVASQTSAAANGTYSNAELTALFEADLDVICNPAPGGAFWAVRGGINTSSNAAVGDDEDTTMTTFLATSIDAVMGQYVGLPISLSLLQDVAASLNSFLANLLTVGILGSVNGARPYSVVCDTTNNPQARLGLGYVNADVTVQTMSVNRFFNVNLQDGPTVTVSTAAA